MKPRPTNTRRLEPLSLAADLSVFHFRHAAWLSWLPCRALIAPAVLTEGGLVLLELPPSSYAWLVDDSDSVAFRGSDKLARQAKVGLGSQAPRVRTGATAGAAGSVRVPSWHSASTSGADICEFLQTSLKQDIAG